MKNCISSLAVFLSVILFHSASLVMAQEKDPVILKVAGEEITKSEFLDIYHKNNINGDVIDQKSLTDYMELFINFKLKVKEAETLGLDTARSFIEELAGYRSQLAQPYLIDEEMNKALLEEAYNRKKEDIRASHILVKVDKNASTADTLEAYKKIMSIRKRILKGEDFGKLAVEFSDDLSARDRTIDNRNFPGNKGDLGYFTAFDMVYPFETGAYNTNVGEVSMPVRSDFGYHLIKVTDRMPALGQVQVAHILMRPQQGATKSDSIALEQKVLEVYQLLLKGEDFSTMAQQYSDDRTTSSRGGVLPWFGSNRMVPELIKEVSKLKVNEFTKPFLSNYGWHIVKLIDKKEIGTFEDNIDDLKQNLARGERAKKSEEALISRIKREYKFTENLKAKADFYKMVTDTIFSGKWDLSSANKLGKKLFTLGNKVYMQQDFAKWLASNQRKTIKEPVNAYINKMYTSYVNQEVLKFEDSQLESKYPEFKSLMKEYHDGILLFGLTEQKIWSRAIQDTIGLKAYYNANKNKYMWGPRVDATIYTINSVDAKIIEKIKASVNKGMASDEFLDMFNNDSTSLVTIDRNKFSREENEYVDSATWEKGSIQQISKGEKTIIVLVNEVLPPQIKELDEAKGIITADYQDFLEKEWIKELRSKYKYEVNEAVLSSI